MVWNLNNHVDLIILNLVQLVSRKTDTVCSKKHIMFIFPNRQKFGKIVQVAQLVVYTTNWAWLTSQDVGKNTEREGGIELVFSIITIFYFSLTDFYTQLWLAQLLYVCSYPNKNLRIPK